MNQAESIVVGNIIAFALTGESKDVLILEYFYYEGIK